ncbi:MAG: hypothetical protein LBV01_06745, partial [Deltaproteobacteria bacterium]|nr:hypothetical protein [Deltaproteobacteria bacterium]
MKIHYHLSEYISHRKAGQAYMRCLRDLGHTLVDDPGESELVVLHEEPFRYARTLAAMPPRPGRRHVGYAVWETPQLPRPFVEGVRCVDAVWTPSEFSRQAFAPHARALVLPHVVERPKATPADTAWAVERLGLAGARRDGREDFLFYAVIDTVNPRKDAHSLFTAFAAAFPGPESRVRLVVKQYRQPLDLAHLPWVIDIPEMLSEGRMAALHAVCDAFVSPHHAEAWGLSLS